MVIASSAPKRVQNEKKSQKSKKMRLTVLPEQAKLRLP
jgi:hypothetical protein